jgi:hypothetical protein
MRSIGYNKTKVKQNYREAMELKETCNLIYPNPTYKIRIAKDLLFGFIDSYIPGSHGRNI